MDLSLTDKLHSPVIRSHMHLTTWAKREAVEVIWVFYILLYEESLAYEDLLSNLEPYQYRPP